MDLLLVIATLPIRGPFILIALAIIFGKNLKE